MSSTSGTKVTVSRLEAKTVFVRGLDHDAVTTTDIRDWLGQLGVIETVSQELEAGTMKIRFKVVFEGVECAEQAVKALDGATFKNRTASITSTVFGNVPPPPPPTTTTATDVEGGGGEVAKKEQEVEAALSRQWEYLCTTVLPLNRGSSVAGSKGGRQLYVHIPTELQFAGPIVPHVEGICTKAGIKRPRQEGDAEEEGTIQDTSAASDKSVVTANDDTATTKVESVVEGEPEPTNLTTSKDVVVAVDALRGAQTRLTDLERRKLLLQERFAFTPLGRVETKARQSRQHDAVLRAVQRHIYETVRVDACVEIQQLDRFLGDGGTERAMLLIAKAVGPVAGAYLASGADRQQSLIIEMAHVVDARVLVGLGTKAASLTSVYSSFHKQLVARKESAAALENPSIHGIIEACLWPPPPSSDSNNNNNNNTNVQGRKGPTAAANSSKFDPHLDYHLLSQCPNEEAYMRQYQQPVLAGGVLSNTTSTTSGEKDSPKPKSLRECMLSTLYQSGALDALLDGGNTSHTSSSMVRGEDGDEEEETFTQHLISILMELRKLPIMPLASSFPNTDNGGWGCNPSAATAAGGFTSLVSKSYAAEQGNYWSTTPGKSMDSAVQAMMSILAN